MRANTGRPGHLINRAIVGTIAVVLALTACGGDDPAGSPAPTNPTSSSAASQNPAEGQVAELAASLQGQAGSAGAVAAVAAGDLPPVIVTSGVEDDRAPAPIDLEVPIAIASLTKSFTAAVVLQLVDEGALALDDPLRDYIPWPDGEDITLRQLLDHTSGVAGFGNVNDPDGAYTPLAQQLDRAYTLQELVELRRDVPGAQPGSGTSYSNMNYVLLGAVIEEVTGTALSRQYDERILEPLGLDGTSYLVGDPEMRIQDGTFVLNGYTLHSNDLPHTALFTLGGPAIAMAATAADTMAFSRAWLAGDALAGDELQDEARTIGPDGFGLAVNGYDPASQSFCGFEQCPPDIAFDVIGLAGNVDGVTIRVLYDPARDCLAMGYVNISEAEITGVVADALALCSGSA